MSTVLSISDRVRSTFGFSVDKFPLSGPESMRTPFYGLFRSDNLEAVGKPVSRLYVPHQTDDVLALVDAVDTVFDGVADVKCHFHNGHYVAIEPLKEQRLAIYGTKDNIFPRVFIRAGYDGNAFKASIGYYRDACRNMSIMKTVKKTTVSIRHSSGLRDKMDDLVRSFSNVKASWGSLCEVITNMEQTKVSMVGFLNSIYGQPDNNSKHAVTAHKNRTEAIFRRLQRERVETGRPSIGSDFMVSAWEAYNAVQGYVQWDSGRRGNPNDFARVVAANSDVSVQTAESLALAALSA